MFIIIDDDPTNNTLCKINIRRVFENAEVLSFETALEGLTFLLQMNEGLVAGRKVALLVDINMPDIDGFHILDQLKKFPDSLMKYIHVFVVSSTIDNRDVEKAMSYDITKGFISKPLTIEKIAEMFAGQQDTL